MKRITLMMLALLVAASLLPADAFASGAPAAQVPGIQAGNGRLVISEAGSYTLTGSMRGTVCVDPGAGDVELILDNVSIDGAGAPAVEAVSGGRLTVIMAPGSQNEMTDGNADNAECAVVYSRIPIEFGGQGRLTVTGLSGTGIAVPEAALSFGSGWYSITAPGACLVSSEPAVFGPDVTFLENGRMTAGGPESLRIDGIGRMPAPEQTEPAPGSITGQQLPSGQGVMPQIPEQDDMPEEMTGMQVGIPGEQSGESGIPGMPGMSGTQGEIPGEQSGFPGEQGGMSGMPGMQGDFSGGQESAGSASEILTSSVVNTAADLEADMENAQTIIMTEEDSQVKIDSSGTYVITGSSSNGNITVKKGSTGVVLVLEDLDLTSTTGAALSINKDAQVKVIVSGQVRLTDAENPDDENSADADVADAFDGAVIKIKAGAQVYLTGSGDLTLTGLAKNGIKTGDGADLVMDGDLSVHITAANDGINANFDLTILGGSLTIEAGDDAVHADHILTIGREDGTGPHMDITACTEGLEGTVVNMFGGRVTIRSTDDAVNAANGDGLYEGELAYSFNMTGGTMIIRSSGDGVDSNGNVNLLGGSLSIQSASAGGEAGIDYDGSYYIAAGFDLGNQSGVTGPDGMPGQMMAGMPGMQQGQMTAGMPGMRGQMSGMQGQAAAGMPGMVMGGMGQTGR